MYNPQSSIKELERITKIKADFRHGKFKDILNWRYEDTQGDYNYVAHNLFQ